MASALRVFGVEVPSGDTKPTVGFPENWVHPQSFDRKAAVIDPDSKADYHWFLRETQVNAASNAFFVHHVRQFLTASGVQGGANLSFTYDPGYQSLTLHWIRLWRGTNLINRLDLDKLKIARRENDLEQYIMDGTESAVLVIDDVRVGDILDYAYTKKGENPVFGDHFDAFVPVQQYQSVDRLMTKVLWPTNRRLFAKAHGCAVQPAMLSKSNQVEYTWDFKKTTAVHREDSLPRWYDPEPWVQLSDFRTWAEVNQWALAMFKTNAVPTGEFLQRIAAWKRIQSKDEQVLAVLKFVQDDVRYFGIEIGASSEKPADPYSVFSRRYGDCKDKSFLFVTILRMLGIEAYPVLVHSEHRQTIADWQPSAAAFDHCIAEAHYDGQTFWLDPTLRFQGGTIPMHYLPAYLRGLVIAPRTTGLADSPPMAGLPKTTTTEYFLLRGKNDVADLKVVSIFEGRDADRLRELISSTKRADLEKDYLHYYAETYPGTRVQSPLTIEDDELLNVITINQFYAIDHIWRKPEKDEEYSCSFYPYLIGGLLKKPIETERAQLFGLSFPQHVISRIEITLPQAWPADSDRKNFANPAFTFRKNYNNNGNWAVMEYEYNALTDSVSPDQLPQYLEQVSQASQALGRTFTLP